MFYHLDNFSMYDEVRISGVADTTWLEKVYLLQQSADTNFRVQEWGNGRIGIGTHTAFTGSRGLYMPIGGMLSPEKPKINVTQRLLDFVPNGTASFGIAQVIEGVPNLVLAFGFNTVKEGFIVYRDENDKVVKDIFQLTTALTGTNDLIEWGFEKKSNNANWYESIVIWVNNKPTYANKVFNQIGSSGSLGLLVSGGVPLAAEGADTTDYIGGVGTVSVPKMGMTDLVINDGNRNGLIRVLNRTAAADRGPNTMAPSGGGGTHASLISGIPPNENNYLVATSAVGEEMFIGNVFDGLSSESVLAFGLQVLSAKNNPFALDLMAQVRVGATTYDMGDVPVDLSASYRSLIIDKNPANNLAWTALEANSANFGFRVV